MSAGFVIGPLAIQVLGTEDGLAFAACAVLVALVAFGLALLSRRARVEPGTLGLADLPRFARAAPLLLLLVLAFGFVDGTVLSLSPLHMIEGGASAGAGATFVAVMHGGMILAQPVLGLLLDRMDRWRLAAACLLATGVAFGALMLVPTTAAAVWILGAIGGAAFFGIYTCALAILGREHGGAMLVAGASVFSLAYAAGGALGPALSGSLMDAVPGSAFALVVLLGLGGAALVMRRTSRGRVSPR